MAALLAATNPFLTHYAQETRMYALVVLLGVLACGTFGRAYVLTGTDAAPSRAARRRWAAGFAVALAALMYTHNWALFFAAGCGLTWLGLLAAARGSARRELLLDGVIGFGGAVLLFAPWLPTLAFQVQHTGAPWSTSPGLRATCSACRAGCWGRSPSSGCCSPAAPGDGPAGPRGGRFGARGRALLAMGGLFVATVLAAYASSQVAPAWAARYFAVALPPLLLLVAGGLAHAGRLGLVGALLVALIWAGDGGPAAKSNVRAISEEIAPSLKPGDVVVSTQPEQIPVLSYYLPPGLRYATLWGPVDDLGVTDWRDGVRAAARDERPEGPRAAARRAAARAADRARRADHQQPRTVAGAVDRARARPLVGVAPVPLQRPAAHAGGGPSARPRAGHQRPARDRPAEEVAALSLDPPFPAASRRRGRSPEPIDRDPSDPPRGTAVNRL